MSKETKKYEFSSQDELDYSLGTSGPLYIDPRHLREGYHYCFVSDKPGEIDMYKRRGYTIVQDEFKVGDQVASTSHNYGSAVTVQSKCGQLLVLMAIDDEKYARFEAFKDKKSKERTAALGKVEGIPDHLQYGSINITK